VRKCIFLLLTFFILFAATSVSAQSNDPQTTYFEAKIINIEDKDNLIENIVGLSNKIITVASLDKSSKNKVFTIDTAVVPSSISNQFKPGDTLIVSKTIDPNGKPIFNVVDYVRKKELLMLFMLFFLLVVGVARFQGIFSFVGMIVSFFVIMNIIIPQILAGNNPVFISIFGAIFIVPITFYLSHGINKKTTIAIVGTLIALVFVAILSHFAIDITRLTGFVSEEASFIQSFKGNADKIQDLLLAGIIISTLGILDDITISQTSVVQELVRANPKFTTKQLFTKAMAVGRDHIGSLVNTLVLVYAGASLPLFILFAEQNISVSTAINHELIATEIVKILVSSIGLVLSVPITTLLAAHFIPKK